jgi:signal transduction histidine kinase
MIFVMITPANLPINSFDFALNEGFIQHDVRHASDSIEPIKAFLTNSIKSRLVQISQSLNEDNLPEAITQVEALQRDMPSLVDKPFKAIKLFVDSIKNFFSEFFGYCINGEYKNEQKTFKPQSFFEDLKTKFSILLGESRIIFDFNNIPTDFTSDQVKLERILHNLIINANSAMNNVTGVNDHICLKITGSDSPKKLDINISNPALKTKDLEAVFAKETGAGQGLHIVKTLTQALGGTITINTDDNRVEFKLSIPDCSQDK